MKILGIQGMTNEQIQQEVARGGRFVIYQYCISILIMTFKRPSGIHFVRGDQNAVVKGLGFSAVSMLLGWWGFPWGPIYTIGSMWNNFSGGLDVTRDILNHMDAQSAAGAGALRAAA